MAVQRGRLITSRVIARPGPDRHIRPDTYGSEHVTESISSNVGRKSDAGSPLRSRLSPKPRPARRIVPRTGFGHALRRLGEHLVSWYLGWNDRRQLASLDDRMLRDLGIDRAAVDTESTVSHWRLPYDR